MNEAGQPIYDYTIIMLLKQYLPAGVLGLGITALLASFMSGMAGECFSFLILWTSDPELRRPVTKDKASDDKHSFSSAGWPLFFRGAGEYGGRVTWRASSEISWTSCKQFFKMVNAPLFAVIFLGMFWKRATGHAAFTGLLAGFFIALLRHGLTFPAGANAMVKGGWIAHLHAYPVEMAQNFWTAIFACSTSALLTVVLSFMTTQKKSDSELKGLVYALTPKLNEEWIPWYSRSSTLAIVVLALVSILTIYSGKNTFCMGIDIKIPIGLMFTIFWTAPYGIWIFHKV